MCTVVTDTLVNGRGVPPDLFSRVSFNGRRGRSPAFFVLAAELKERSSFFAVEDVHLVFVVAGAGDLFGRNGGFEVSDLS